MQCGFHVIKGADNESEIMYIYIIIIIFFLPLELSVVALFCFEIEFLLYVC